MGQVLQISISARTCIFMDIDMQNLAKLLTTDEIYKYIIGHIAYILIPAY